MLGDSEEREINRWIASDLRCSDGTGGGRKGLAGNRYHLEGADNWTESHENCLSIQYMGDVFDFDDHAGLLAKEEESIEVIQLSAGNMGLIALDFLLPRRMGGA